MQPDAIKSFIHEQIDLIQDPTDLGDLLEIVTTFVDSRLTPMLDDTPAELDRLRKQLRDIEEGRMKFIPHEQVIRETKQFIEDRRNDAKA